MIQHVSTLQRQRARAMRSTPTDAEGILWQALRAKRLHDLKFRRQVPMGNYIIDFFCPDHALIVEADGKMHEHSTAYDAERTSWLEAEGYRVLRFTNKRIETETPRVLAEIAAACGVKL